MYRITFAAMMQQFSRREWHSRGRLRGTCSPHKFLVPSPGAHTMYQNPIRCFSCQWILGEARNACNMTTSYCKAGAPPPSDPIPSHTHTLGNLVYVNIRRGLTRGMFGCAEQENWSQALCPTAKGHLDSRCTLGVCLQLLQARTAVMPPLRT